MLLVPLTIAIWAMFAAATVVAAPLPVTALFPLSVLVAGFEAIHALHAGTERIGRYLQVYYERFADGPRWETAAAAFGPALPGGGIDPLFSVVFAGATLVNIGAILLTGAAWFTFAVLALFHAAFLLRIARARMAAARQRAVELESFGAVLHPERDDRA